MNTDQNKKKSKKIYVIVVAAVLVIAAATVATLFALGVFAPKPVERGEGVVGVVSDNWDPGVEQPSGEQRKGTQIPGYSKAEMNAGDMTLKISIGNPKDNKVGMIASFKLEDGTVLFESDLLKPGQGMTEIPLNKTLEKGVYKAAVVYQCFALDENRTRLNSAESGLTLYVK